MPSALIATSHGTGDPAGQEAVARFVDALAAAAPDRAVLPAHVDVQQPDVPRALQAAPEGPAVILPLLVSAGYHVHVDLARAARAAGRPAVVAEALGPDRRLAVLLAERLDLLPDDVVVLIAAGSSDARAQAACREAAALLADELGRPVELAYLSAAEPRADALVRRLRGAAPGRRVVGVSYLLAPGWFQTLAERCGADLVTGPLLPADGPTPEALVAIALDRAAAAEPAAQGAPAA
ncbi:sirohydrochlorin chelatase [Amnibacterium endophyticum]|uniref:Sirohydrochlorin chelatase n=1 Tax=Amnibacterium endophyticum TaxID=2109337 RepID=A0ABW4LCZ7_9MICO